MTEHETPNTDESPVAQECIDLVAKHIVWNLFDPERAMWCNSRCDGFLGLSAGTSEPNVAAEVSDFVVMHASVAAHHHDPLVVDDAGPVLLNLGGRSGVGGGVCGLGFDAVELDAYLRVHIFTITIIGLGCNCYSDIHARNLGRPRRSIRQTPSARSATHGSAALQGRPHRGSTEGGPWMGRNQTRYRHARPVARPRPEANREVTTGTSEGRDR